MMLAFIWLLARAATADDYTYDVSDPVYTKLTNQLQRLGPRRRRRLLRLSTWLRARSRYLTTFGGALLAHRKMTALRVVPGFINGEEKDGRIRVR